MMRRFLLFLALVVAAFGQAAPTHIGQHRMGETVQEWNAIENNIPDVNCHGEASDGSSKCTVSNNRAYTWKFQNGTLSAVDVTPDWSAIYKKYSEEGVLRHPEIVPAFEDEVKLLTEMYGAPATVKTVPYQNALGAHWERSLVMWNEPDGTTIVAFERTGFNYPGQLELVTFQPKDSATPPQHTIPNPYK